MVEIKKPNLDLKLKYDNMLNNNDKYLTELCDSVINKLYNIIGRNINDHDLLPYEICLTIPSKIVRSQAHYESLMAVIDSIIEYKIINTSWACGYKTSDIEVTNIK